MLSINDKIRKMGMDKLKKIRMCLYITYGLISFFMIGIIFKLIWCKVMVNLEIVVWCIVLVILFLISMLNMYILAFYICPEIEQRERDQQNKLPKK